MPAIRQTPTTKPTRAAPWARGTEALDGLDVSLGDAQKAITELRRDLGTGRRRLVKDVETAVKNARRDLVRTRKAIQHDIGDLGGALTPRRADRKPVKPTAKKPTAKKPAAKKPAAKKPTAKKPTAKKPTAKKSTAKKSTAKPMPRAGRARPS